MRLLKKKENFSIFIGQIDPLVKKFQIFYVKNAKLQIFKRTEPYIF